ncbi:GATA-type zinc finger protein 1 [Paramisgurnus dabryanus]|uniref:GATA-type zinc finger protein 1 n=1 Tax=Paramisgurnus dabryanus TaxID=90735 RepID=UPI0031F3714F
MSSNPHAAQDLTEDTQQHPEVTQSSILYLLQEATKLAAPAGDHGLSSSAPHGDASCSVRKEPSCSSSSEFTGSFSIMRESVSSNAWEVMRLINQQCEWLLRSGCGHEEETETDSLGITEPVPLAASHSCCHASTSGPHEAAVLYGTRPTNELSNGSDEEEIKEPDGLAELIMSNTAENVCRSKGNENCWKENPSVVPNVSRDEMRISDPVAPSVGTDSAICPVDFTSCLVSEREGDNAWLAVNAYESQQASSQSADVNNNLEESLEKEPGEPRDLQEAPSQQPCRRTQRKQPHPARSPDPRDPDVLGVTFSMHPELNASTDECRLVITSNCSEEIRRIRRTRSGRCRSFQTSQRTSSSEEESDSCGPSGSKMCASCLTRKTPLWRDAEDGTPLCNACGIRYKKYRVRCHHCWNIPKKDAKSNSKCLKCGDVLGLNSQQKSSSW